MLGQAPLEVGRPAHVRADFGLGDRGEDVNEAAHATMVARAAPGAEIAGPQFPCGGGAARLFIPPSKTAALSWSANTWNGWVAEWSIAPHSKCGVRQRTVSSNLTPSATKLHFENLGALRAPHFKEPSAPGAEYRNVRCTCDRIARRRGRSERMQYAEGRR